MWRVLTLAALGASLLILPAASADESDEHPGLPEPAGVQYAGAIVNGLGTAEPAQQSFLVPISVSALDVNTILTPGSPEAYEEFNSLPGPAPCEEILAGVLFTETRVYPISPPEAPEPFGYFPPIPVRTVAFGSIPTEAVVTVSLARTADNLPIALMAEQQDARCRTNGRRYTDARVEGLVRVEISDVQVDGIPLQLKPGCSTTELGTISMMGKGFYSADPSVDRDDVYVATLGGLLSGTVDIPPFANCVTAQGEDVSRLFTAMVSAPGNPLQARQGNLGACFPTGNPDLCRAPRPFDLSE